MNLPCSMIVPLFASPMEDLEVYKIELATFLAETNRQNSRVDEVPLPFYSVHKRACVFHFRSQHKFIDAISIACHPSQVEELYDFVKRLLLNEAETSAPNELTGS